MNEEVKAEVVEEKDQKQEKQEEKKPGFFSKLKKSFSDSMLESNIRGAYEDAHKRYRVFEYGESFLGVNGSDRYGEIVDDELLFFGDEDIKINSVVIDTTNEKAYYVVSKSTPIRVKATVEGTEYERGGLKVKLDENVKEVKVIKADKRYFLYLGE